MVIDIKAPQSLLDLLAANGLAVPVTQRPRASCSSLSLTAPGLEVGATTCAVDPAALAAFGTTIWDWYCTHCLDSAVQGWLVARLRTGVRRSTRLRPADRVPDIDRVLAALLDGESERRHRTGSRAVGGAV